MPKFAIAVFEPDQSETTCVIMYYCCYRFADEYVSESTWVVPGTWGDE